jgi:putative heme-binding domain-containing protein
MRNVLTLVLNACMLSTSPLLADQDRAAEPITKPEIYGQGVRETTALTPEQERAGFHLPDGFEAQLFVSEPEIAKPLNMAWDTRGRLWITNTIEYPYPAKASTEPRDSIKILEDTDGDGRADKVTTFADKLNIPMGLLPVRDGVICFNIPDIVLLKDNDGDDRADERVKLLGPFDTTRDTHGMINALRRGGDGWIYACHGFNNQSSVTAKDGSSVKLISGNTFRFREDGSRIEQFTTGQVNPFGMTSDEWGNWYTADCHSKPITALLPGGCYPSFGRKHDGLGFAPSMMDHLHGSTAICGLVYYQADQFPANFRNRFFSGNVMTSRINCNAIERNGANVTARELPDFMTSDDPWFRPVDIQLGPDGGLYVADFYNKIIGHYEVPLEHPERDRTSGRIWRIFYSGKDQSKPESLAKFAEQVGNAPVLSDAHLKELSSGNPTRRELAIERGRIAVLNDEQIEKVRAFMLNSKVIETLRLSCLSILWSRGKLQSADLLNVLSSESDRLKVEALRAVNLPMHQPITSLLQEVRKLTNHREPQVRLAAIEALGRSGNIGNVIGLVGMSRADAMFDATTRQACRIAVRNLLRYEGKLDNIVGSWRLGNTKKGPTRTTIEIDEPLAYAIATILPALDSDLAREALLAYVSEHTDAPEELVQESISASAKNLNPAMTDSLIRLVRRTHGDNPIEHSKMLDTICSSISASNGQYPDAIRAFATEVAQNLGSAINKQIAATDTLIDWRDAGGLDWSPETRKTTDGKTIEVLSSLSRGEAYVGTLSSSSFDCPSSFRFWVCGHNGHPDNADSRKNFVRLVDAMTGQAIVSEYPPRNDTAHEVKWDLSSHAGKKVRMEVVDGDKGAAFAWLAVGRFSLSGMNPSRVSEHLTALRTLLKHRIADTVSNQAFELLASNKFSPRQSAQLIAWVADARQHPLILALAEQAIEMGQADQVTKPLLSADAEEADEAISKLTKQICLAATARQQSALATRLMKSKEGSTALIQLIEQGKLNLACMRGKKSLIPITLASEDAKRMLALVEQADLLPDTEKKVVQERLGKLDLNNASIDQGKVLFEKNCVACHQLKGKGLLVGPQLDDVGKRGIERLCEDILDPHRNVDTAFRMSILMLDDDRVLTGLVKEQADGSLQVIGQDGKATQISAANVSQRRDSTKSVMPDNFVEVLNDSDLSALLKFLTN